MVEIMSVLAIAVLVYSDRIVGLIPVMYGYEVYKGRVV